jgi:hypothetical protein
VLKNCLRLVSLSPVLIKVLYVFLVLSTLVLLATAGALYLRVRRHMTESRTADPGQFPAAEADSSTERNHG